MSGPFYDLLDEDYDEDEALEDMLDIDKGE